MVGPASLIAAVATAARPSADSSGGALQPMVGALHQTVDYTTPLPEPRILGRILLTENVSRAANFFVTHFEAVVDPSPAYLPAPSSSSSSCAEMLTVTLPHHHSQALTFVSDSAKPNPASEFGVSSVLQQAESEMLKMDQGGTPSAWTCWEDNHDGYGAPLNLDIASILGDRDVGAQCYGNILRTAVPGSMLVSAAIGFLPAPLAAPALPDGRVQISCLADCRVE